MSQNTKQIDQIKLLAENDLYAFIRLVAPHRLLGDIHKELIAWLTRQDAKSHQLVLIPRGHQKSALAAYYAAWEITRNPAITILYLSATTPLALDQLRAIKQILSSDKYKKYWPEMLDVDEGKREEWAAFSFRVDHPKRREEGVRDSTCRAASITTNITGFHCDLAILDDVVINKNAYNEENRKNVLESYSFLASIENADAREVVVGTRYHHADLYNTLINMKYEVYDVDGNIETEENIYEVFERVVEDSPERNGSGEFLWPRHRRKDGKYFGFNKEVLAKKKAQYQDTSHYFCFTPDTLVYSDRGICPIGDISVGDFFNKNKVTNIFKRSIKDENILDIKVAGVPEIISVTKGHKFPIRVKTRKKDYGVDILQIGDILKDNISTKRFYLEHKFNTEIKDNEWDEDSWWFIGHYLAEGYKWKDRYICLVTRLKEEKEIHTKLRNILNSKNIKYHEYDKEAVKIFYITWPKMNKYLTEFGYMCYGKYLNQEALIAPHNKQRALIDGYLRGDGFKLKNQKGFGITSVSLLLLEGIKDILLRLGEIPYIVKLYEKGSRKSFGYNVRTAYSIRWYGKSHQKNFIEGDKYYQQIYKNKIKENTYSGDVYTLEVNESHEYNVMGLTCKNSQYYNDPSDPTSSRIDYNTFNYYKKEALEHDGLHWFFNKKKLSIYAGMDFAWTISKRSDYTAIVTIGITNESDILILDIDRFKTEKVSEMWDHVLKMHHKWDVRRLRAETNMGQKIIVAQFKEYIRQQGSLISVDDVYRTRHEGTKRERNTAILEPRYSHGKIWHYKGGNCQILEEELVNNFPEHDDIEDALASAVEIAKPPRLYMDNMMENNDNELVYNGRFGGIG